MKDLGGQSAGEQLAEATTTINMGADIKIAAGKGTCLIGTVNGKTWKIEIDDTDVLNPVLKFTDVT